jgi:ubiquitin carboxyl-terminal hydrolase 47
MTPEFRTNILTWKYIEGLHSKREDCIPFQLQKLFARMQLRLRESETTEDLTKSFQWGHQQLLEQHDIQELCRVLFEAIETSLSEMEENFINHLYQGCSSSVVKCLECNYESEKKDYFLDISLPVRNDFDKIYNSSLEMAFFNFLRSEKLINDNQYKCEYCAKKVDALKFTKFTKLPKILFLQMNRFEYDYLTDGRKKLCDRVTFPMILNMNSFYKK